MSCFCIIKIMITNMQLKFDSPEEKTNIFGRLVFSWMTPLMRLGYQKPLTMDDLWYTSF